MALSSVLGTWRFGGYEGHRLVVSVAGEAPDGVPHEEASAQALGTPGVSGGWDDGRKTSWPSVMGRMLRDDSLPGVLSGARLAPSESRGAPLPVPSSSTSGGLRGNRLQTTDALQASGPRAGVLPRSAASEPP